MSDRLKQELERIVSLARREPKPLAAMGLKLFEEGGELAEAVNHHLGYLPHKTMKEPLTGEVADVLNVAISILVKAYSQLSNDQILGVLADQLALKSSKWEAVIEALEPKKPEVVNFIVTIDDYHGHRVVECGTAEEAWTAVGKRAFGGAYRVSSPTGRDVYEFVTF